ncbi:MAG: 6-phosphogluconolactonase [Chlamydiota bacterium]|nr:6-phosphogluconolactonase [Chlamydiota bacterium]
MEYLPCWNEEWQMMVPGDHHAAVEFAAQHFMQSARKAIEARGRFTVALAGGSTPGDIYALLAQNEKSLDWERCFFLWGDERAVSLDHPESNYFMAMEAGLKHLPIPHNQHLPMKAEREIVREAEAYEEHFRNVIGDHPLDLMMLGMGEDGHTASLFPHTEALHEEERWVVANGVPQKKCWRMTLTYPCIRASRQVVVYVMGQRKAPIIHQLLDHQKAAAVFPIAHIGKAQWILDKEASSLTSS